jgi:excisionase family DNA binding protein
MAGMAKAGMASTLHWPSVADKLSGNDMSWIDTMDLKEASQWTGLSERTLRRFIKEGKINAVMVGAGSTRHWDISPEALEGHVRNMDGHDMTNSEECTNCAWLRQQIDRYDRQLEVKDTQISELHVLLQTAQKALPAPQGRRRWWWPWR